MSGQRLVLLVLVAALVAGCSDEVSKEQDYLEGLVRIGQVADEQLGAAFNEPAGSIVESRERMEPPQRWPAASSGW